jgi:hypothetical protein
MAISSVKTSSVINGFPKDRSLLAGNVTSATPSGYVAVSIEAKPYLHVYRWHDGFGRRYSDPASLLPEGVGRSVRWSRSGNDIAVTQTSPGSTVAIYSWDNLNGFGAKHTSFFISGLIDVEFNPGDTVVALSSVNTPYVHAYPFTSGVGVGTKYANPATLTEIGLGIHWSPSGNAISLSNNFYTPFISVLAWSNGFGTKYANPATLPTSSSFESTWSPSGNDIAVPHSGSPFISVYPWSNGFGTKYANPATLPPGTGQYVAWSPSGNQIVLTHSISPFISAYDFTSGTGFGTKYADPIDLFTSGGLNAVKWHASGNAILFNCGSPSRIGAYRWSNGFQTKYDNPIDTIIGNTRSIDLK